MTIDKPNQPRQIPHSSAPELSPAAEYFLGEGSGTCSTCEAASTPVPSSWIRPCPAIDMEDASLLIEFAPGTSLYRERDRVSQLPIIGNGPAGTFVVCPGGLRVSLPTDQIVFADEAGSRARVGFGGMSFEGTENGRLIFLRVRELHPEDQLSPARSHKMMLEPHLMASVSVDGRRVWPVGSRHLA